jgi:hypothetical protein
MELSMKARKEIYAEQASKYREATKKGKGKILDEVADITGGNRDYLATMLRNYNRTALAQVEGEPVKYVARNMKKREKRSWRPRTYTEDVVKVLTSIWADFNMRDPKRLIPDIRGMMEYLKGSGKYDITEEVEEKLMRLSASQATRLLKPAREKLKAVGISTTKRSAEFKVRARVPVCTYQSRVSTKPGNFASDTVAHCGSDARGHFCKSLTYRDIYSGWLEVRSLLNSAQRWVKERSERIKESLPFPLIGVHDDNGGEYINKDFIRWCIQEHIHQTRGRPNKSNDNPLAEQTNYDAVRKIVGYYRFDTQEECDALDEVYTYLCPLYNYWFHSAKLINRKTLTDGRVKKEYEKEPKTPYERLLESPDISEESKEELRRRKAEQNPVELNERLWAAVDRLLKINGEKGKMKEAV